MSRDCLLLVFSWISFPPAPEYPIRTVWNFVKNSRRYSQVKSHHRCQQHLWEILPSVSLLLLIPVANLPPGSTILASYLPLVSTTPVTADTFKWTWRQKFLYMLTLLPKGVQTKYLTFFWLKIFSICHRCQRHRRCTLSCEYLCEFFKKFEPALCYTQGLGGNWFMKNTRSRKSRGTAL